MNEGNVPSKDGKAVIIAFIALYCIYCNFKKKKKNEKKKETKLFEFSRDTGREVLKIKKKNDVTLQWLYFSRTRRHIAMASHCNDTT